jgi:hypothetical protein
VLFSNKVCDQGDKVGDPGLRRVMLVRVSKLLVGDSGGGALARARARVSKSRPPNSAPPRPPPVGVGREGPPASPPAAPPVGAPMSPSSNSPPSPPSRRKTLTYLLPYDSYRSAILPCLYSRARAARPHSHTRSPSSTCGTPRHPPHEHAQCCSSHATAGHAGDRTPRPAHPGDDKALPPPAPRTANSHRRCHRPCPRARRRPTTTTTTHPPQLPLPGPSPPAVGAPGPRSTRSAGATPRCAPR